MNFVSDVDIFEINKNNRFDNYGCYLFIIIFI